MPRLVDLSHAIEDGMATCAGLPAPRIRDHLGRAPSRERYAPGTEFQIGTITMVANTGTYIDSPFHRYADRGAGHGEAPGLLPGARLGAALRPPTPARFRPD